MSKKNRRAHRAVGNDTFSNKSFTTDAGDIRNEDKISSGHVDSSTYGFEDRRDNGFINNSGTGQEHGHDTGNGHTPDFGSDRNTWDDAFRPTGSVDYRNTDTPQETGFNNTGYSYEVSHSHGHRSTQKYINTYRNAEEPGSTYDHGTADMTTSNDAGIKDAYVTEDYYGDVRSFENADIRHDTPALNETVNTGTTVRADNPSVTDFGRSVHTQDKKGAANNRNNEFSADHNDWKDARSHKNSINDNSGHKDDKPSEFKRDTGIRNGQNVSNKHYDPKNKKQYRNKSRDFYKDSFRNEEKNAFTDAGTKMPEQAGESRSEMLSRMANQEFFDKQDAEDERNIEYISQREETRARRAPRHHRFDKSLKDGYIEPKVEFNSNDDFMGDSGAEISDGCMPDITGGNTEKDGKLPGAEKTDKHGKRSSDTVDGKPGAGKSGTGISGDGISGSGTIDSYEQKAAKARQKTQKARKHLPKRKEYRLVKQFDPTTGKITYELETFKKPKTPKKGNPATVATRRAKMMAHSFVHQKVSEEEKDNAGVEAAHKAEQAGEEVIYRAKRIKNAVNTRKIKRVAALEKKQFKAETNLLFHKYLEENPEMKKRALKKFIQKQRIKREYAMALRKGAQAKEAAVYAQKAVQTTTVIAAKIKEFIAKHMGLFAAIAGFGLLFIVIATGVSSCGAMFGGGLTATMMGSYQSKPAELDKSDDAMTVRELELQNIIDNIETDHPDYDEYEYNLGEIGHDPFVLISYLSAMNIDFAAVDVDDQIEALYNQMYSLTLTPRIDIRTRTVRDDATGEEYEEEYEVRVLQVELTSRPMEEVVGNILTGDEKELYDTYMETRGALQQFYTPLDLDWYHQIKSYYGYRKNPTTGENQFHRGIDIAVPEGTLVYAAQDGTVRTATYDDVYGNYIVIADAKNYVTKYAHLATMNVSEGQDVKYGAIIGTTGSTGSSTGSHLHLECLADGEYYNPLFYFENGNGSIYGTTDPIGGDGDVAALIFEAEKYLGFPYVWGGSSPSTSFDCSGYVSYVLKHSGYYNMPRTTAQGIFNQCTPISPSEARAGDLVFFTKTYNSGNPVTHVGIYAGNGQMIHCGDPIKYTSINTSYWQSHFYSFARLPGH